MHTGTYTSAAVTSSSYQIDFSSRLIDAPSTTGNVKLKLSDKLEVMAAR